MIDKIKEIPVTQDSCPFATAYKKCSLHDYGYFEKEYFMYGTSNIYCKGGGPIPEIKYRGAKYCNRFIVRGPLQPSDFSGRVIIEILNPTASFDIDRMWLLGRKYLMENGDLYIGITSKPDVLNALLAFDRERYSALSWESPVRRENPVTASPDPGLPPMDPTRETGLFWDMLTDLAKLVRKDGEGSPVKGYAVMKLHLTGWSQSANYLIRYVNSFAYLPGTESDGPIFDGYLAAGAVHKLAIPLNQEEYGLPSKPADTTIKMVRQPYIALQTESENANFGAASVRQNDSDAPDFLYRIYEIAGASHDSKAALLDYYKGDTDMERIGLTPQYAGEHQYPNDYPYEYVFHAAFRNLFRWAEEKVSPPHAPKIPCDSDCRNLTDQYGNAIGGVRTPFIDLPTCIYHSCSNFKGGRNPLFGYIEPFSPNVLKNMYHSLAEYREKVNVNVKEQIQKGFLLSSDADEIIAHAVCLAKGRGLTD